MSKSEYAVNYKLNVPLGGVKLKGGRLGKAFDNNVSFLKGFNLDRILWHYRHFNGRPAPGAPYAAGEGHFENNLHGQTAGEFLMGACTSLLWCEDSELRSMSAAIVKELKELTPVSGQVLPITDEEWHEKEYPNYTRAWVTFGLIDAGNAGIADAFSLARSMGDYFNHCDLLGYVKDMNLGFQGILANTRLYDSLVGDDEDVKIAEKAYVEEWWLKQLIAGDHRAIYAHPGNHPHSTLLTTLEGILDLYRATGKELYLNAVKAALPMYEDKWQHVGGGIAMCEDDNFFPGCLWLSKNHNYNELCSTNFWVLLNQRMHRLFPDNVHYVDEMEKSIYNVLLAAQVGDKGYHYLNFLEKTKDWRWLDRCTCCASLGTRLAGLLPQFLYTYTGDTVYVDMYADSTAELTLESGKVALECISSMPDRGYVRIKVTQAEKPFTLKLRIPGWCRSSVTLMSNSNVIKAVKSGTYVSLGATEGDVFELFMPFDFKVTRYTGAEQIYGKERYALEYGPILYSVFGKSPVELKWDVNDPEGWLIPDADGSISIKNDNCHRYVPYMDIDDEPFSTYPVIESPEV